MAKNTDEIGCLTYVEVTPEHPHYFECSPDWHFAGFHVLDVERLVTAGIKHITLDCDGTVWPNNGTHRNLSVPKNHKDKIAELTDHPAILTVNAATECGYDAEDIREDLGLERHAVVIKPWRNSYSDAYYDKMSRSFWRKLLFELDCLDSPQDVAMVGNSMARDVAAPAGHGIRTVLVDTLQYPEYRGGWAY